MIQYKLNSINSTFGVDVDYHKKIIYIYKKSVLQCRTYSRSELGQFVNITKISIFSKLFYNIFGITTLKIIVNMLI